MQTIGDRLKYIRKKNGVKQKELAEYLGIKLPGYNRIEKGFVDITLKHLISIRKRFNISLDWLITGMGPESPDTYKNSDITGPSSFGEFSGNIRQMLQDMKEDPVYLHGMLSQYHEIKQIRTSQGNGLVKEVEHEN